MCIYTAKHLAAHADDACVRLVVGFPSWPCARQRRYFLHVFPSQKVGTSFFLSLQTFCSQVKICVVNESALLQWRNPTNKMASGDKVVSLRRYALYKRPSSATLRGCLCWFLDWRRSMRSSVRARPLAFPSTFPAIQTSTYGRPSWTGL